MKRYSCFLLILTFFTSSALQAQQIFRLSQYMQHNYLFNPAAAGAGEHPAAGITYKKMWTGIEDGPQTLLVYGDKYFASQKTGVGLVIYNDVTGPTSRSGAELNVSYSIPFANKKRLMFGLAGQFAQERIDKSAVEKYIPGDPILAGPGSVFTADAAAGVYFTSPTINIGFSTKQLIQSKIDLIKTETALEARLYRHYYLMGSYNWQTDEDNVLVPNFLVKFAENAPADVEAGCRIEHKKLLWLGFNFHMNQDFSAFAGFKLDKKLSIGYAYDQYKTPLSIFDSGGGSHELTFIYSFQKK